MQSIVSIFPFYWLHLVSISLFGAQPGDIQKMLLEKTRFEAGTYVLDFLLSELNKSDSCFIVYDDSDLPLDREVVVDESFPDLGSLLGQICQTCKLQYRIHGKYIILKPLDHLGSTDIWYRIECTEKPRSLSILNYLISSVSER